MHATVECDDLVIFVYGVTVLGDPRICPSLGMAREIAGGGK